MKLSTLLLSVSLLVLTSAGAADAAIALTFSNSFQRHPSSDANLVRKFEALPDLPTAGDFLGDQVTVYVSGGNGGKLYGGDSTGNPAVDDALATFRPTASIYDPSSGRMFNYGADGGGNGNRVSMWDFDNTTGQTQVGGYQLGTAFGMGTADTGTGDVLDVTAIPGSLVGKSGMWGLLLFSSGTSSGDISGSVVLTQVAVPLDITTADSVTSFGATSISGLISYVGTNANNVKGIQYDPGTGDFWITTNGTTLQRRAADGSLVDSLDITTVAGLANPAGAGSSTNFDVDYVAQSGSDLFLMRHSTDQDFGALPKTSEAVIYHFTVVPEPATMALLALGGLGLRRRRRRRA